MTQRHHYSLVDTLIGLGHSEATVRQAAEVFYSPRRFGQYLVSIGAVDNDELELALIKQRALNRQATAGDLVRLHDLADRSASLRDRGIAQLTAAVQR